MQSSFVLMRDRLTLKGLFIDAYQERDTASKPAVQWHRFSISVWRFILHDFRRVSRYGCRTRYAN
jgi:hypothetical protein